MKFETTFARIISSLFHPLVIPTLGIFILFSLNTYISFSIPPQSQRIILLVVIFNTAIAPLITILILKRMKVIKSVLLESRAERIMPVFITGIFYFFTFYILKQSSLPFIIYFFILSATILIFMVLLISMHWKISIHMTSIGGFTGFLISTSIFLKTDIPLIIISGIIISGLLGYSRIKLEAHSPAEVYVGFGMGLSFIIILTIFLS
jgi:hypothetical protein